MIIDDTVQINRLPSFYIIRGNVRFPSDHYARIKWYESAIDQTASHFWWNRSCITEWRMKEEGGWREKDVYSSLNELFFFFFFLQTKLVLRRMQLFAFSGLLGFLSYYGFGTKSRLSIINRKEMMRKRNGSTRRAFHACFYLVQFRGCWKRGYISLDTGTNSRKMEKERRNCTFLIIYAWNIKARFYKSLSTFSLPP